MNKRRVLMIYIEPTSYLLGLIRCLRHQCEFEIDVCFAAANFSQRWDLPLDPSFQLLPASFVNMLRRLQKLFASGNYAVVHLAGWGGHPVFPLALLLAKMHGIAVSMESDTPIPYGQSMYKRIVKRLVMPLWFRLPDVFLPGGKRQAALLRYYGVAEQRINPAGMTVDVVAIQQHLLHADRVRIRQALRVNEDTVVILYVGRMEPHKGIHDLLDAYQHLQQPPSSCVLVLVGEGSLSGTLAGIYTTDSGVRLMGRLSGSDLLDIYAAADIFVLPSHFEPWGLVVNEAMAAGLPVLVSERAGCVDDLLQDGVNGLIIHPQEPLELAAALQTLLKDKELLKKMSMASLKVIADWTLEREANNMAHAWSRMCFH